MLKMKQFRGYQGIWCFSSLFLELLKQMKSKLTVGLEPTTAGLEVQRAIQLRHASCCTGWNPMDDMSGIEGRICGKGVKCEKDI